MKLHVHINLSLNKFRSDHLLEYVSREGLKPEFYLSGEELDTLSESEIEGIGKRLREYDLLPITIHAPFHDLNPGAVDPDVRNISLRKLRMALSLSRAIPVVGIVVHSGYSDWHYDFDVEKWLEKAVPSFSSLAEEGTILGTKIFVENIFERNPGSLLELKERVGSDNLFFCFDPGHGHLFSSLPLVEWIGALGDDIAEVHLHDNCGTRDEHLPLLEGGINFRGIIGELVQRKRDAIFTLEPHTFEHALRSVKNFRSLVENFSDGTF